MEAYESGQVNSSQKKLKKSDNKDLDETVLFTWFKNNQTTFLSTKNAIKENALGLAKSLVFELPIGG